MTINKIRDTNNGRIKNEYKRNRKASRNRFAAGEERNCNKQSKTSKLRRPLPISPIMPQTEDRLTDPAPTRRQTPISLAIRPPSTIIQLKTLLQITPHFHWYLWHKRTKSHWSHRGLRRRLGLATSMPFVIHRDAWLSIGPSKLLRHLRAKLNLRFQTRVLLTHPSFQHSKKEKNKTTPSSTRRTMLDWPVILPSISDFHSEKPYSPTGRLSLPNLLFWSRAHFCLKWGLYWKLPTMIFYILLSHICLKQRKGKKANSHFNKKRHKNKKEKEKIGNLGATTVYQKPSISLFHTEHWLFYLLLLLLLITN